MEVGKYVLLGSLNLADSEVRLSKTYFLGCRPGRVMKEKDSVIVDQNFDFINKNFDGCFRK